MLLLKASVNLFIGFTRPSSRKALPDRHIRLGLGHQSVSDILLAPIRPLIVILLAEGPNWHILPSPHELTSSGCRLAGDGVNIHLQFFTVGLERQVIDIMAKRILDFATNSGKTNDNIRGKDTAGNSNPAKGFPELEGKHHNVHPGDLRDSDGIGDWERCLENTIHTGEGFVELNNTGDGLVLVKTNFEGFVVNDAVDIAGDVIKDFEREVTKRLLGALYPLTRVGLGESDTKIFANSLDLPLLLWFGDINLSSLGKSVQELDPLAKIGVINTRLESKPVLDRAGKGVKEVQGSST